MSGLVVRSPDWAVEPCYNGANNGYPTLRVTPASVIDFQINQSAHAIGLYHITDN